jgi:predicted amidophosphoribosyltransferase
MGEDFFSYNQEIEEEEGLDFNQLVNCPNCKKPIPQDAISCYYCGKPVDLNKKSRWIYLVVILVVIALLSYFIFF